MVFTAAHASQPASKTRDASVLTLRLDQCTEPAILIITTEMREHFRIIYCPERDVNHMKATSKTILFAKAMHERKVHQWPVAIFANADDARGYAMFLKLAYRAKDAAAIKALDPSHAQDADGAPLYAIKWSIVTAPYAPAPDMDDTESEVADETSTA